MKNKKSVAVICSLLFMGPAVLNHIQNQESVMAVEEEEQEQSSIIRNGSFTEGTEHWTTWNGEGGESTFAVDNNQARVTINRIAGMHPDWGIPISWSTQLIQESVAVEANHRYELTFEAKSSVERPVVVEYDGLSGNPQANFVLTNELQTFTHEVTTMQSGSMDFKFLLGNVQHSGATTPEEEHTLTFESITIRSLGEVEEENVERDWQLTWNDEFDGESLDLTKWRIDTGNGFWSGDEWVDGWGNNEKQSYQEDNVRLEDGRLILEAREEQVSDEHGTYDYTSGKILSDGLFSQAYGRFEASMKLPEGQGYWPAFWMMPQDDTYGGWAASGEIDIMENRGSETNKIGGAIHYGGEWPLNTYSAGEYTFTGENRTTDFNTYSVEWEPEEIRWYVNDDLYYRTSDWRSDGGYYPAPFNQEFFIILNLAVGGWYGGEPDATTEFPAQVEVDYVRVYEDANADYEAIPTPKDPDAGEEPEPVDDLDRNPANWQVVGENLVEDGSFDETTTFGNPDNLSTWNTFNLADFDPNGGRGVFSVENTVLTTEIQQVGWNWWQIQLFQDLSVAEGTYKLSFDMTSEQARDMRVELVGSGEEINVFPVNEEGDSYELIFHVGENGASRLLFGFGREHTEAQPAVPYLMTLDNISLREVEFISEEETETPKNNRDNDNHNRNNHQERGNKDNDNHNRNNHENRGNSDNPNRNMNTNGKSN
ncbi:MAG: glycoside hydrolase family 16 protein [Alkalibacterium sp.]|nr:glycoside hydrolase family 16 protein [Alkalibacterium sp.]